MGSWKNSVQKKFWRILIKNLHKKNIYLKFHCNLEMMLYEICQKRANEWVE